MQRIALRVAGKLGAACCIWLATAIAATAFAAGEPATPSAAPPDPETTVYTNLSLIDGTGAPLRADVAIVVKGERIAAVLPMAQANSAISSGARVINGHGAYALPGLIDTHVHMATDPQRAMAEAILRRHLYSGITAVRDMAGDVRALADLSRASLMKEIPAPDLFYAALMAGPTFFSDERTIASARGATPGQVSWMQAITETTDMPVAVAYARGTWATGIKIYANLPGDLVRKITAEAHRQGIIVWSHSAIFPAMPGDVLDAGVDVISHVCNLAYAASPVRPKGYHDRPHPDYAHIAVDHPALTALFDQMVRQRTILDATLRVYAEGDERRAQSPSDAPPGCSLDFASRLTHAAYARGVLISAGTDGFTESQDGYPALHEELELLTHKAGMTPMDVIHSATAVAAMTLGRGQDMGSIAPGKLANMVIVAKNPLEDIAHLRSVVMTVKRGTRYPREQYRPISADEWPANEEGL